MPYGCCNEKTLALPLAASEEKYNIDANGIVCKCQVKFKVD